MLAKSANRDDDMDDDDDEEDDLFENSNDGIEAIFNSLFLFE